MAATETFQCSVVTPEKAILECEASFVAFPAHDGEMGMLKRRAPLICRMGVGILRVETPGDKHVLFVDGGFAQVAADHLTILTEQARTAEDLDAEAAEQSLVEARAMKITDDASFDARSKAIRRAEVQLKLVKRAPQ
jgi:F-type H+-transporting ATPase subunit epsilon